MEVDTVDDQGRTQGAELELEGAVEGAIEEEESGSTEKSLDEMLQDADAYYTQA
jgi:hypothetical protein